MEGEDEDEDDGHDDGGGGGGGRAMGVSEISGLAFASVYVRIVELR